MTKRAVLLITIVGVLCFSLWGYARPVNAATSIIWVKQDPIAPVHGLGVVVWVNFNGSSDVTPLLEYKVDGISSIIQGSEDYPLGFDANWKFIIPTQVQGTIVSYQLLYRNADNSLGGYTGFNWTYTVKVLNATVDSLFDESSPGFGKTTFANIQSAVTSVDPGAEIQVNQGTYFGSITINKPLTIRGVGSDLEVPLINGKIILATQGTTTGLLKLFNLRFVDANDAVTIGDATNANFDQVELNQLTFDTAPEANSKAIQTVSSVQIKELRVLSCVINAAHGIDLNGDIGSATISNNTFNLTGQNAGSFDAIKITQDTKASASVMPAGTLTVQGNTLNKAAGEDYPYASAILNQANFPMTSSADGKKLYTTGNTFNGNADQTLFIQDMIDNFVHVNFAPVADDQNLITAEDTALNGSVTASDVDGDSLTFSKATDPTNGTVVVNAVGTFTYTPALNFNGTDSFTFTVSDGTLSDTGTINISVSAVNDAPVTEDQSTTTTEDTETKVTLAATDVDSETLTFSIVTNPDHGSATLSGSEITYKPDDDYYGTDSFTYKANDGLADSITSTVIVTIASVNDAPTLTTIPAKEVNEGDTLSFSVAAGDVDQPAQTLSFSLIGAPTGASIHALTGTFSWLPTEDQGPQNYSMKVCVSDGEVTTPACQDVAVTVNEVNLPPTLTEIPAKTVKEDELLTFTAVGIDSDLPMQIITYSFSGDVPAGMLIDAATGNVTWTPTEAQGPDDTTVTICVSDGVVDTPICHDVSMTVNEVNLPPTLTAIPDKTIDEGKMLTFTASGSDDDLPAQTLTYSLVDAPTGASIEANTGFFSWTPNEEQGPKDHIVRVCVSDGVIDTPVCQDVAVTVNDVNLPPVINAISTKSVNEGEPLSFTVAANDVDLPEQTLIFSLEDAPTGASIDTNTGVFTWTPTEDQGGSTYTLSICVSDGVVDTPICHDVSMTVNEVNLPPILTAIPDQTVSEGAQLAFTASGSDEDLPIQKLTFSISNAPTGSTFDPVTDIFIWTPGEGQGSQIYKPSICVSDGVELPPTCQEVTITVESDNNEPTIEAIDPQTVHEGELLNYKVIANDTDLPKQELSFSISGIVPEGMQISASTGVFTWTPTEAQGPQELTVDVCVSDGIVKGPICEAITISVIEVNSGPTLMAIPAKSVDEGETLSFVAEASDIDLPKQELTYSISGTAPTGMSIGASTGIVTWTPSEEQGGIVFTVNICASDSDLNACQSVDITVNEVNTAPTLTTIPTQTVTQGTLLTFTAIAKDVDLPEQTLTYSISNAPTGSAFDTTLGNFNWVPGATQGPADYVLKVCVSDGITTTCQDVTIKVAAVVVPPDEFKLYLPIIAK